MKKFFNYLFENICIPIAVFFYLITVGSLMFILLGTWHVCLYLENVYYKLRERF